MKKFIVGIISLLLMFAICSCSDTKKPEHSHTFQPEYFKNGISHWRQCTSCGEKIEEAKHKFGEWVEMEKPTTTSTGIKERKCIICDYVDLQPIPMLHTHSYSGKYSSDEGSHWKQCSCGEKIEEANHKFGEWIVTLPATTSTNGSREKRCNTCQYTIEEVIPMVDSGHIHLFSPNYIKNGTNHWRECECGFKKDEESHIYSLWENIEEATEIEDGIEKRRCSICGFEEMKVVQNKNRALGKSINLITATNYKDLKQGVSILDFTKPLKMLKSPSLNATTTNITSYYSMNEIYNSVNMSNSIGSGAQGGVEGFFCDFYSAFSHETSFDYKKYSNQYFYIYSITSEKDIYYIDNYNEKGLFDEHFSEGFLSALDNLEKTKDFKSFFDVYGTHLVASVVYGGKSNLYYSVVSNNSGINFNNRTKLELSIGAGISGMFEGNVDIVDRISYELGISTEDIEAALFAEVLGGTSFTCTDIKQYYEGSKKWLASLDNNTLTPVFIDYSTDGLIPLWKILPEKYEELSKMMEAKFLDYYKKSINNKLDAFAPIGDIENFAGGMGTQVNPYKISTAEHLLNMKKNLDASYVLINDIDMLGFTWSPLTTFTGHLDGQGFTISNLVYSLGSEDQHLFKFGFCETNKGKIENIVFDGLRIDITKCRDNEPNLYIGAVCGLNDGGSIQNVSIINSLITGDHYRAVNKRGSEVKTQIGGIAGAIFGGKISNCMIFNSEIYGKAHMGDKSGDAHTNIGGIVGELLNDSIIEMCVVKGREKDFNLIKGETSGGKKSKQNSRVGSIVGYMGGTSKINYCFEIFNNLQPITNSGSNNDCHSGSIAGRSDNGSIIKCAYTGQVVKGAGNSNETLNQNVSSYSVDELKYFLKNYLKYGWSFDEYGYPDRLNIENNK